MNIFSLKFLRSLSLKGLLLAMLALGFLHINLNSENFLSLNLVQAQDFDEADFEDSGSSDVDFADFDDDDSNSEESFDEFDEGGGVANLEVEPPTDSQKQAEENFSAFPETSEEDNLVEFEEPAKEEAPVPVVSEPEPAPVLISAEPVIYFDEPDLNYERRLHSVYQDYHNASTPREQWEAMVGSRKKETYEIQSRDTLWDISRTFFGDGEYWPKIWSVNGKITNPHLISKGNSIVFIMGNESEAPAFTVADSASLKDSDGEVRNQISDAEIAQEAKDVVPPIQTSSPSVAQIPPSLPEWSLLPPSRRSGRSSSITISKIPQRLGEQRELITSYISDEKIDGLGVVTEVEAGVEFATQGQYVFIKSDQNFSIDNREKLLVLKNSGVVHRVKLAEYESKESYGYRQQIEGRVEIVEKIEGKDGDTYYKALVIDSFNPILVGSKLVRKELNLVDVDMNGARSNVKAKIIGGSLDNRRKLYSERSITFLDKGKSAGLSVGDILPVHENRNLRVYNKTQINSNTEPTGWIKIVEADEDHSTGIVVKAWKEIINGDQTGGTF